MIPVDPDTGDVGGYSENVTAVPDLTSLVAASGFVTLGGWQTGATPPGSSGWAGALDDTRVVRGALSSADAQTSELSAYLLTFAGMFTC